MLVAHRGFRNSSQENRWIDFKKALKFAKAVEFDIRLTKDCKVIIFHDYNFKRIGKYNQRVKSLTYQEIKNLPYFQQFPEWTPLLLKDFRDSLGSKYDFINIEIKPDYYSSKEYEIILDEIRTFKKLKSEIVVSSFSKKDQQQILTLNSRFKKGYLFEKMSQFDKTIAQKFDYLHPPISVINRYKNHQFFVDFNKPMNVWTYKRSEQAQKSHRLYNGLINGYISDIPNLKIN